MTHLRDLARQIQELREDVDALNAVNEHRPATSAVTPDRARLVLPAGAPATPAKSPATIHHAHLWRTLTAAEATNAWTGLTDWVDWLTERYHLDDTLPPCWYRHGAIVEELDALRAAWTSAYQDPTAKPIDAAFWHELLSRTLNRIRGWDRYGCAAGTHHNETPPTRTDRTRVDRDNYLDGDIQRRPATTAAIPADRPQ